MVPSTTFPNPRRFPQQQEVVKSTCRCMYWFRRLKYCAPCHPVVFAFAPSSCWLRLELFFDNYTNFNGGQSDLQKRSTNLRFWNFTFGDRINCSWTILLVVLLWEVASPDCPPLRFEKIIDLLISSMLPHSCLLVWCLWSLTAGGGGLWSMLVVCSAGRWTRGRCREEECSNFKRLWAVRMINVNNFRLWK